MDLHGVRLPHPHPHQHQRVHQQARLQVPVQALLQRAQVLPQVPLPLQQVRVRAQVQALVRVHLLVLVLHLLVLQPVRVPRHLRVLQPQLAPVQLRLNDVKKVPQLTEGDFLNFLNFMKKIICVCGIGMVGKQVADWFKNCLTYDIDPNKKTNTWEECTKADAFFLCVPTPYVEGEEYDLTALKETIEKIPDGKIIVIKSTVNPGTTDDFARMYPKKIFLFNPEFLTELSAHEDFFKPDMQIIGVTHPHYELASELMLLLPPAPVMRIISPVDAEWVKKMRNAFYGLKVIFFNQLYDIVCKTDADYETIRSIVVEDKKIGNSHSFIFHKNYRGYGGACIPKDLNALIEFAKKVGSPSALLELTKQLNVAYNRTQGIYREPPYQVVKREKHSVGRV